MREIERLPRQITNLSAHEVRTNLLFTMSNRTGSKPKPAANSYANDPIYLPMSSRHPFKKVGGAGRDRTDDPLLAKQVLSQLSYGP